MPSTDPRRFPVPPAIPILGLLIGWGLSKIWPVQIAWPSWARVVGVVIMVLAFAFASYATMTFRRHKTVVDPLGQVTTVVTSGPYQITRNPMYLSLMVFYCGGILAFHLPWSVVLLPLVFLALHYGVIAREERYLRAAFGEPYLAYCRHVRRWI